MSRIDFTSKRLFVAASLAPGARFALSKDQANYLVNVLRMGEGDGFLAFNGRDGEWRVRLSGGSRKAPEVAAVEQTRLQSAPGDLWLAFAPLKSARLDYMAQKAVEMGASRLVPVVTRRTVAARLNLERLRANVIEAAEQCGVLAVPDVAADAPLSNLLAAWPAGRALIFCDEDAAVQSPVAALGALPRGTPLAVVIGPEGGFEPAERAAMMAIPSCLRVSLGPRILRADTAAVAALALVQAVLGDYAG